MRRLLLALLALPAACKPSEQPKPASPPMRKPRVTVQELAARPVEYAVEAAGTIEASEEISIPAGVSGIVDAVSFKQGDRVDEKKILVEIDAEKFRLGEDRAAAEFDRAKAQADLADTLFSNRLKLYEEGRKQNKDWVTEEQMATSRADANKARAELSRSKADLELARRDHRNARVRSPIPGLINQKLVSRGEFVKAETVVATILNVGTLHVRFTVPELESSRLQPGQEIRFAIRSAPGRTFTSRLFYLSQKADPATRSVECKAEVRDPAETLRPGTFAQIRFVTGVQESISVPERAVLHTEKGFTVYVTDGRVARVRPVKLGLRIDGQVEILEGVRAGERLVVDGALTLRDGAEIEVVPAPTAPLPPSERKTE